MEYVAEVSKVGQYVCRASGREIDKLDGAPLYEIVPGRGQYLTVRSTANHTPVDDPDRTFDGETEDRLMDIAETYANDGRDAYRAAGPPGS